MIRIAIGPTQAGSVRRRGSERDVLAVVDDIASDPLNLLLAEQPRWPHQQESERGGIGEPDLYPAADEGSEIDLGQLLGRADEQASDDRARDGIEAAEHQHRQRFSTTSDNENGSHGVGCWYRLSRTPVTQGGYHGRGGV